MNRVIQSFMMKKSKTTLKSKNILISAHGNSIRALCTNTLFKLDNNQISGIRNTNRKSL